MSRGLQKNLFIFCGVTIDVTQIAKRK